ncbi:MAG: COQ9 family protein [Pseudomonadota bacterium]
MTDRQAQKDALLLAALEHVPFEGWGKAALGAGARDLDLESITARRLFPQASDSLLDAFDDWADRQMLDRLEALGVGDMRLRDRITAAVKSRLEVLAPYREATRRALAARALPTAALGGWQALWRTVDRMWLAAGDTKSDGVSTYTKRIILSGVWTSTLLFWMEDNSDGYTDTWSFLDRRVEEIMQLGKLTTRVQELTDRLPFPKPGASSSD